MMFQDLNSRLLSRGFMLIFEEADAYYIEDVGSSNAVHTLMLLSGL